MTNKNILLVYISFLLLYLDIATLFEAGHVCNAFILIHLQYSIYTPLVIIYLLILAPII